MSSEHPSTPANFTTVAGHPSFWASPDRDGWGHILLPDVAPLDGQLVQLREDQAFESIHAVLSMMDSDANNRVIFSQILKKVKQSPVEGIVLGAKVLVPYQEGDDNFPAHEAFIKGLSEAYHQGLAALSPSNWKPYEQKIDSYYENSALRANKDYRLEDSGSLKIEVQRIDWGNIM